VLVWICALDGDLEPVTVAVEDMALGTVVTVQAAGPKNKLDARVSAPWSGSRVSRGSVVGFDV